MPGAVCSSCDLENLEGARFCSGCGAALVREKSGDALIGKTIAGKFRVEKLLGNGAMGRVYKATHVALDRGVALKVMHDHLARSAEFATRFVREARAASRLDHPHSIRVLDFGRTDPSEGNLLYLVMELFVGGDLYGVLRDEGPIEIERGLRLVSQVLSALEDAHAIDLVHRDIKPENVLVGRKSDGSEIAKICDFGIAKAGADEGLSHAGHMIGTPLYMSPEAAMGRDTDARSDLYSVAIMLYEIVCGSRPFTASSPLEVARLQVEEIAQLPAVRAPERNIDPSLERVIMRGLAKRKGERFQSAREFREAIETGLGAFPKTTPCMTCRTPVPNTSRFCPACGTPRSASAARMNAVTTRREPTQIEERRDRSFVAPRVVVPDRPVADLRRAVTEVQSERRNLAILALDLFGAEDAGEPEEIASRLGARHQLVARALDRSGAVVQGAGGMRITALFGVEREGGEEGSLVARAVEAAYAIKHAAGNARWFKGGIAAGVCLVSPGPQGPTVLGAALQNAGRNAELARAGELLVDESIRARIGRGFSTAPARAGLHRVREDVPPQTASTMRPFVGRKKEIEQIHAAVRASREGRGQVIAIRGEGGVGKSALVREAIASMRDLPIRWLRVACRPTGATELGAFRELVLAYAGADRGSSPELVRTALAGLALAPADQRQIVSLLVGASAALQRPRTGVGTVSGNAPSSPEVAQREGGAAIRNFVTAALKKGDLGIVVEDLQWIDAASAGLLAKLAAAIAKRSATLIVTARAGIWSDWSAAHFTRITLGPLPPPAASKLLESMLPDGEIAPPLLQSIRESAGGNPLLLESIVEALRASSALSLEGGRYTLAAGEKLVAEGLRGLVEARLRALDHDTRRTLLLASIAGDEIELSDLQALAGFEIEVESAARELVARGLLEERARTEAGVRRVGFPNDGVREVLYDTIALAERRSLHGALAERWETIRAATKSEPVPLEELARHWELAGALGPAAFRLEDAASDLLARGEAKAAALLLRRACAHVGALDPASAIKLVLLFAESLAQVGDLASTEAALGLLDFSALKLDPAARAVFAAKADRLRGTAHRRAGRPAEGAQLLRRALDRAIGSENDVLACDLQLELSAAFEEANQLPRALEAALAGLALATGLADRPARAGADSEARLRLASFLNTVGRLHLRSDDAPRAADYFRLSLAQAERIEDAAASARALANLAHIAARRDDFRVASAESARALDLAREAGDRMAQARIHVNLGHYLARLGRRREAEESYRAAQSLAEAIGWSEGVSVAHQALEAVAR